MEEEIIESDARIHSFLKQEIQKIISRGLLTEVLLTHTYPLMVEERIPIIEEKIIQILGN